MDELKEFLTLRLSELGIAQHVVVQSFNSRTLPNIENVPENVIPTTLVTLGMAHIVLLCATKQGRRLIYNTLDTSAALILLALLVTMILGLPAGKIDSNAAYIGYSFCCSIISSPKLVLLLLFSFASDQNPPSIFSFAAVIYLTFKAVGFVVASLTSALPIFETIEALKTAFAI